MKILTYSILSLSILLINSLVNPEGWEKPKNLSKMRILYKSGGISGYEKPIIAFNKIYFLHNDCTHVYNLETNKESILPPKIYRKPLLYTNTIYSSNTLFLTKDCKIFIYKENGENTFESYNLLDEIYFRHLGSCYDSLRIYYDHTTKYAAIYNEASNKNIIILDLEKIKGGMLGK